MPWVNVKKAAETFDVSEETIRRWIGKGLLESHVTGGMQYVYLKNEQLKGAKNQTLPMKLIEVLLEDLEQLQAMAFKYLESIRYFQKVLPDLVWEEDIQNKKQWGKIHKAFIVFRKSLLRVSITRTLEPNTLKAVFLVWERWMECRHKDAIREWGYPVQTHSDEVARILFTRIIRNL